jgi:MinD superfamily P-loop ATPase
MKEMVVISGKGGTGKTSVLASFAALAENAVVVDCDVDAADLHLLLAPTIERREEFRSGRQAVIHERECTGCGACLELCRFDAIERGPAAGGATFAVDPAACEGCGVCVRYCPANAIGFPERSCGEWYVSRTRFGPMVHARLGIASESSGKLVSIVRGEARRIAEERGSDWVLADGPPGIGCPVIASVTGATLVLAVAEPTSSGGHDLARVLELARHFEIPSAVCVNKWDLNPEMTERIERDSAAAGARVLQRVPYDRGVTAAQIQGESVVENGVCPAADSMRKLWENICGMIK